MTNDTAATGTPRGDTLVWDLPVRLFHWLMVGCFAVAWLTAESERWRLLHVTCGYTLAGLVAFRVVWGVVGPRHARFASFVRGPRAAWRYLRSLLPGAVHEHHVGHNPAGALAIVGLLALIGITTATGWATYSDLGGEWLEDAHEAVANGLLALALVHVAGVVIGSWVQRENLVKAMWTGRKRAAPEDGIGRPRTVVAAVLLAGVAGFWALQWQAAPAPADGAQAAAKAERHAGSPRDRDDD